MTQFQWNVGLNHEFPERILNLHYIFCKKQQERRRRRSHHVVLLRLHGARVLLEKLMVVQVVNKFPVFCGNIWFRSPLVYPVLSQMNPIQALTFYLFEILTIGLFGRE
jgi:hypothetical protein